MLNFRFQNYIKKFYTEISSIGLKITSQPIFIPKNLINILKNVKNFMKKVYQMIFKKISKNLNLKVSLPLTQK